MGCKPLAQRRSDGRWRRQGGAVHDLADAVGERAERHGHQPSVTSRATEEIAIEARFAARSDGWQPIRTRTPSVA